MSGSDKKVGVVGLSLFDLRRRGKVGKLSMVGTSGSKFPAISELCSIRDLCIV
jgi:D-galacturonate reductase